MNTSFLNTTFVIEKSVIYFETVIDELEEGEYLFRFLPSIQIDDECE